MAQMMYFFNIATVHNKRPLRTVGISNCVFKAWISCLPYLKIYQNGSSWNHYLSRNIKNYFLSHFENSNFPILMKY